MIDYTDPLSCGCMNFDNVMLLLDKLKQNADSVSQFLEYSPNQLRSALSEIRASIDKHCFVLTSPLAPSAELINDLVWLRPSPYAHQLSPIIKQFNGLADCLGMDKHELNQAIKDLDKLDDNLRAEYDAINSPVKQKEKANPKKETKYKDYER